MSHPTSTREQADSAFKVMAEYRRRLIAAGFVFGEGPLSDCVEAGPGVDPMLAMAIWHDLTGDDAGGLITP